MLNRVTILGHVGKDPDIRRTQSGDAVANFSLATTKKWKEKGGEQKEHTEWHRITFFGRLAEVIEKYVAKGSLLYVEGELTTRKWKDANGNDKYSVEIKGNELKLLGGKTENHTTKKEYVDNQPAPTIDELDEDIPF